MPIIEQYLLYYIEDQPSCMKMIGGYENSSPCPISTSNNREKDKWWDSFVSLVLPQKVMKLDKLVLSQFKKMKYPHTFSDDAWHDYKNFVYKTACIITCTRSSGNELLKAFIFMYSNMHVYCHKNQLHVFCRSTRTPDRCCWGMRFSHGFPFPPHIASITSVFVM